MKKEKRRLDLPVIGAQQPVTLPNVPGGARVGMITLGCDKNTVDSERIMARLAGSGANVSTDIEGADVIVINTCGFIDRAKEESIEAMLDAVKLKQEGRVKAVVAIVDEWTVLALRVTFAAHVLHDISEAGCGVTLPRAARRSCVLQVGRATQDDRPRASAFGKEHVGSELHAIAHRGEFLGERRFRIHRGGRCILRV